ncbi:roadblock/LC7 domain-containing protein [Embleya sp. NPDC020630]|uniref:roadblock/LC7 domain-containing protein n=1 Tax=Embleya sp. NPDC020630 TaxID=3363979 RepID=UPI0037A3917F
MTEPRPSRALLADLAAVPGVRLAQLVTDDGLTGIHVGHDLHTDTAPAPHLIATLAATCAGVHHLAAALSRADTLNLGTLARQTVECEHGYLVLVPVPGPAPHTLVVVTRANIDHHEIGEATTRTAALLAKVLAPNLRRTA